MKIRKQLLEKSAGLLPVARSGLQGLGRDVWAVPDVLSIVNFLPWLHKYSLYGK